MNDLKLLVDVAWANREKQSYLVPMVMYSAAERLTKRGLIVNGGGGTVQLTHAGEVLVVQLENKIQKVRAV